MTHVGVNSILELALTILIFGLIGLLIVGSITYAIAVVLVLRHINEDQEEDVFNDHKVGSDTDW
jgi:hypothetical protein